MIKSAVFKLTFAYLSIIMVLSLGFSFTLYHISDVELGRGLRKPVPGTIRETSMYNYDMFRDDRLRESRERLKENLILLNIITATAGFAVSYLLARKTLEPIAAAMESQQRFTADASHELRTPLTAMQTEIEVSLRDKNLSIDDARDLLKSNLEEVAKMRMLADGLLKLARHTGKPEAASNIYLYPAADIAVKHHQKRAADKEITIENSIPSDMQAFAESDSVAEVIAILIDNAIKYSQPNTNITISAELVDDMSVIRVSDQGMGISKKDLPHIFERFYRADQSRARSGEGGHGIGLSIADKIIKIYGGTLAVEPTSKKGTTFAISLPGAKS